MTRLKAARLRRHWSQTELAHRTGVSYSDISKIERGRALPYPSQATRLARALRIPRAQLLDQVASEGDAA